jgi:beta-glucanase (GH16 family)
MLEPTTRKRNVWLLLPLLMSLNTHAQTLLPMQAENQGWQLLPDYSDEFDAKTLNTAKWNTDVPDWGCWSWENDNVSVNKGSLAIQMKYQPHQRDGKTLYYTSGIIQPKAGPLQYGYFEARIKGAPLYPGVCPAFWLFRKEPQLWTEIDIMEITQLIHDPNVINMNLHVFMHPSFVDDHLQPDFRRGLHSNFSWKAPWSPRDDFHVYGCEWDAQFIRWYVDGKLSRKTPNTYNQQSLDLTVSMGIRPPLRETPTSEGLPTSFLVDYVRVWQRPNADQTTNAH